MVKESNRNRERSGEDNGSKDRGIWAWPKSFWLMNYWEKTGSPKDIHISVDFL